MHRISIVGSTGAGKTTMARAVASRTGAPHLELDAVFHQPGWTQLPDTEFRAEAHAFVQRDRWVIDGNYRSHGVLDIVWGRADTVVWLDLPKRVVMARVTQRSVHRALTGRELWNGNKERPRNLLKWNPDDNIIRWAWTRFDSTRATYERRMADPRWGHLGFFRIVSGRDAEAFLDTIR